MTWVDDLRLCDGDCAKCSHDGRRDCRILFLADAWEQTRRSRGAPGPQRSVAIRALKAILATEPGLFGLREVRCADMVPWLHGGCGNGIVSAAIRRLERQGFLNVVRSERVGVTNLYEVCEPSFRSIFGVEYAEMGGDVVVFLNTDVVADSTLLGAATLDVGSSQESNS